MDLIMNKSNKNTKQLSLEDLWNNFDSSEKVDETPIENNEIELKASSETESFPLNLVRDFESFIDYTCGQKVELTKTNEHISRKHLLAINNLLSVKNQTATAYTDQEYYPYIHFFYYVALSGRLLEKVPVKQGKLQLKATKRLQEYKELSAIEKYFFLLETFWVDVNWARLLNERYNSISMSLKGILYILSQEREGYTLLLWKNGNKTNVNLNYHFDRWGYFLLYFEWLGLWECEINQGRIDDYWLKNCYFAKSIKLTAFGAELIPVLLVKRSFDIWNIALRRENGEFNPMPGAELGDMMYGDIPQEMMEKDQSSQPFFQPFTELFQNEELQRTLPRRKRKFVDGRYTFKVSYTGGIWRKVVLSGKHTMNTLHDMILDAFDFDDDHLYSFFMDGVKWSTDCITSPYDNDGQPVATEIQIGEIGLEQGQRFLYLFDYGDEWTFVVEVENIQELDSVPFKPYLMEGKGKAPAQYPEYYEED
jgi:hypothetical protein